jgi:hypothetical protein
MLGTVGSVGAGVAAGGWLPAAGVGAAEYVAENAGDTVDAGKELAGGPAGTAGVGGVGTKGAGGA